MSSYKQRTQNKAAITVDVSELSALGDAQADTAVIDSKIALPVGFKTKKLVTVPSLAIKNRGQTEILRFDGPIHISTVVNPNKPNEKPADIAHVTDMQTGEQFVFLVSAVVKSNLEKEYEDGGYVGKTFAIKNLGQASGKRHANFSIMEVEGEE